MNLRMIRRAIGNGSNRVLSRELTTRQIAVMDVIRGAGHTNDVASLTNLTDDDGVQQFILGVHSMDANVRVGRV